MLSLLFLTHIALALAESTLPDVSLTSLSISAVQTASKSVTAETGTSYSAVTTSESAPLVPSPSTTQSLTLSLTTTTIQPAAAPASSRIANIFQPITYNAPPQPARGDHPVPRTGIRNGARKIQTNKFYANLFLGDQSKPVYTFPYTVAWAAGRGVLKSYGMAISHSDRSQITAGPIRKDSGAWSYFYGPPGIQSIVLSAAQLGNQTTLTTDTLTGFSVNANLSPSNGSQPMITFPLLQGMGFVSAVYNNATPVIGSGVGFLGVTYAGTTLRGYKYVASLFDGKDWIIYVFPYDRRYKANTFTLLADERVFQGPSGFSGLIQVAKLNTTGDDPASIYDSTAGTFATGARISASSDGTYQISWSKRGVSNQTLMMFALPHHLETLTNKPTGVQLFTNSKGMATAVLADSWTLKETLPTVGFAPNGNVSQEARALISRVGSEELAQNMTLRASLDSMYYSGKVLAKYASALIAINDIAKNSTLAHAGLQQLKLAFSVFVNNKQPVPLAYDSAWGGVVSTASYASGSPFPDFGNTFYNDHHFHYGYFVYAAAVIGYLDPTWVPSNKAWVQSLVRDYANSVETDPYFPFSRNFDWYHGHSWAGGIIVGPDGKNEESSSEDAMASYAIKLWGRVIKDGAMEARGGLMLAIQARSYPSYFLYTSDNKVQPAEFINNKVAGILFENKIDHKTYFGDVTAWIEGIHMIPILPYSAVTRRKAFVKEEWDLYFANKVDQVDGGWRGIVMSNLALIDPVASYKFFADAAFNNDWLDGGASRAWYIAFAAASGGSIGVQARDSTSWLQKLWSLF